MYTNNTIKIIDQQSEEYPFLLKQIQNPPKKIFIKGNLPLENEKCISIVGTRKATQHGKDLAKKFAQELSSLGITIISGLALGIDTAAHEGVVEVKGKTVAILGNGLNKIYPAQNENLAKKILELGGGLISEYEPDTPSLPHQFLERNKIISGLSIATIIIEAPDRSGSLATARNALEQNREVLVVPGPINHPNYIGSHKLIRDGARLITSVDDILEDLNLEVIKSDNDLKDINISAIIKKHCLSDQDQIQILDALICSSNPVGVDKIIEITKLQPQTINRAITYLLIAQIIKETESGYIVV